jgi:indole-3-pyruvate monooxygenase
MATNISTSAHSNYRRSSQSDTIIIGADPAGLAVGACLKRADIPFFLLEQSDKVGASWHGHYDRLHIHTNKATSNLPYLPFPQNYPRYPSRRQMIDYLELYAEKFQLERVFGQRVTAARRINGLWEVQTQDKTYQSVNLVVATGYNRKPNIPTWPGQRSFRGTMLHSSEYRNGVPFKNRKVLIVGFGNSGGEIALDVCEHGAQQPAISVRSPVNVLPRDLFGIPVVAIGIYQSMLPPSVADALNAPLLRLIIGDLSRYGLRKLPLGPMTQIQQKGRIPLIDIGTVKLIRKGRIDVYPGVRSFTESGVVFTDGREREFDAVILATGYRPYIHDFLRGVSPVHDDHGTPLFSGEETPIPGLYFCGFYVAPTGMLREVNLESRRISSSIVRKYK